MLPAPSAAAQVAVTGAPTALRAAPTGDGPALREMEPGAVVALIGAERVNGFWLVRTSRGEQGWVAASGVQVDRARGFDLPPPVPFVAADWPRWADPDGDCRDTLAELLIRDSHLLVEFGEPHPCEVVRGRWYDPFMGRVYEEAARVRPMYLVPLAEVHASGGWRWDADRKRAYVNELVDLSHLVIVGGPVLVMRRGRGPEEWLPPSDAYRCEYVRNWRRIKERWSLTFDSRELEAVRRVLEDC